MRPAFAGPTAEHYRRYRRDVPGVLLDRLVAHAGLSRDDVALDLGAGTGQVAVPLVPGGAVAVLTQVSRCGRATPTGRGR